MTMNILIQPPVLVKYYTTYVLLRPFTPSLFLQPLSSSHVFDSDMINPSRLNKRVCYLHKQKNGIERGSKNIFSNAISHRKISKCHSINISGKLFWKILQIMPRETLCIVNTKYSSVVFGLLRFDRTHSSANDSKKRKLPSSYSVTTSELSSKPTGLLG